jgi:hypothetical protein
MNRSGVVPGLVDRAGTHARGGCEGGWNLVHDDVDRWMIDTVDTGEVIYVM